MPAKGLYRAFERPSEDAQKALKGLLKRPLMYVEASQKRSFKGSLNNLGFKKAWKNCLRGFKKLKAFKGPLQGLGTAFRRLLKALERL